MVKKIEPKKRVFFISNKNKDIFDFLSNGKKYVETRAATVRNLYARAGDTAIFICNKKRLVKKIKKISKYKNIDLLLKKYSVKSINPSVKNKLELREMYYSFPGYKEKIKKFGILAFELE